MITSIFYSIFFGTLDLIIFLVLAKGYKISNLVVKYLLGLILLDLFLLQILDFGVYLSKKEFLNLMFFSFSLIIIHFVTEIQFQLSKREEQKNNKNALLFFNLLRKRLFYIMIFTYQLLYIWIVDFR